MAVEYLGIHIDSLTYIAILLFGLIAFVIIWTIAERKRQKKHHERLKRMKKNAELRIIG